MNEHTRPPADNRAHLAPLVTFGPTLARSMSFADAARHFENIPSEQAIGVCQLALVRTHMPGMVNVECLTDIASRMQAIVMLRVAERQLSKLAGATGEFPILDPIDGETIRLMAEDLVDNIRASKWDHGSGVYVFRASREHAVRAVAGALARMSITPTRILGD